MASNVNVNNEAINAAVVATIAGKILEAINAEDRGAILRKSTEESMKSWYFRNAVEKAVAAKAAEVAARLCETEEWGRRITETIREGFENYLSHLKQTVVKDWPK